MQISNRTSLGTTHPISFSAGLGGKVKPTEESRKEALLPGNRGSSLSFAGSRNRESGGDNSRSSVRPETALLDRVVVSEAIVIAVIVVEKNRKTGDCDNHYDNDHDNDNDNDKNIIGQTVRDGY
jgi:hypothetical protein